MPLNNLPPLDPEGLTGKEHYRASSSTASTPRWLSFPSGFQNFNRGDTSQLVGADKQGNGGIVDNADRGYTYDKSKILPDSHHGKRCYSDGHHETFHATIGQASSLFCDSKYHPCKDTGQPELYSRRLVDDECRATIAATFTHFPQNFNIENASSSIQLHSRNQNQMILSGSNVSCLAYDVGKEHDLPSTSLKPLKWPWSVGQSSLGAGISSENTWPGARMFTFSHLSSGKDLSVLAEGSPPCEQLQPQKRQRLGWGQGLAKYEKQKIQLDDDKACKKESAGSIQDEGINPAFPNNRSSELHPPVCISSPKNNANDFTLFSDMDKKPHSALNNRGSPHQNLPNCIESSLVNYSSLDQHETAVKSLIADSSCNKGAVMGETDFAISRDSDAICLAKDNILKLLEETEGEIDLLENELKSIDGEIEVADASGSGVLQFDFVPCKEQLQTSEDLDKHVPYGGHLFNANGKMRLTTFLCSGNQDSSSEQMQLTSCIKSLPMESSLHYTDLFLNNVLSFGYLELADSIMETNKNLAKQASEILGKVLIADPPISIKTEKYYNTSFEQSELKVKKQLEMLKSTHLFRDEVIAVKYRALHHLWVDHLRSLSLKKPRSKSQKRFEANFQLLKYICQQQRPSYHQADNLTAAPEVDFMKLTQKLVPDCWIKRQRDYLKMPALLLDRRERTHLRFISNNALVEDPCSIEKERAMVNPWTPEEKKLFMEKLVNFGKDFTKISSFIEHKTTADCIEFYYKNHKSESFAEVKKRMNAQIHKKQIANAYLVPSQKKLSQGKNAVRVGVSGSLMFNQSDRWDVKRGPFVRVSRKNDTADVNCGATLCDISVREGGNFVPKSPCSTVNSVKLENVQYDSKSCHVRSRLTLDYSGFNVKNPSVEGLCAEVRYDDWTDDEKSAFIVALKSHGKNFGLISKCVGTRTEDQCKIFFSKARNSLRLDGINQMPEKVHHDNEHEGVIAVDSVSCSTQSCSAMDAVHERSNHMIAGAIFQDDDGDVLSVGDEAGGSTIENIGNLVERTLSRSAVDVVQCHLGKEDSRSKNASKVLLDQAGSEKTLLSGAADRDAYTENLDCKAEVEQGPEISSRDQCLPESKLQVYPLGPLLEPERVEPVLVNRVRGDSFGILLGSNQDAHSGKGIFASEAPLTDLKQHKKPDILVGSNHDGYAVKDDHTPCFPMTIGKLPPILQQHQRPSLNQPSSDALCFKQFILALNPMHGTEHQENPLYRSDSHQCLPPDKPKLVTKEHSLTSEIRGNNDGDHSLHKNLGEKSTHAFNRFSIHASTASEDRNDAHGKFKLFGQILPFSTGSSEQEKSHNSLSFRPSCYNLSSLSSNLAESACSSGNLISDCDAQIRVDCHPPKPCHCSANSGIIDGSTVGDGNSAPCMVKLSDGCSYREDASSVTCPKSQGWQNPDLLGMLSCPCRVSVASDCSGRGIHLDQVRFSNPLTAFRLHYHRHGKHSRDGSYLSKSARQQRQIGAADNA